MIASGTLLLSLVSVVRHHGLLSLPPFQRLLHKAVLGELQQLPIKVYLLSLCAHMHVHCRVYIHVCGTGYCLIFNFSQCILPGVPTGVEDAVTSATSTMAQ